MSLALPTQGQTAVTRSDDDTAAVDDHKNNDVAAVAAESSAPIENREPSLVIPDNYRNVEAPPSIMAAAPVTEILKVTLPIISPPPDLASFANPSLLFIRRVLSGVKSRLSVVGAGAAKKPRVVALTRRSIYICKEGSGVKRNQPVSAVRAVSINRNAKQVLLHIGTNHDLVLSFEVKGASGASPPPSPSHSASMLSGSGFGVSVDDATEAMEEFLYLLKTLAQFHEHAGFDLPVHERASSDLFSLARVPPDEGTSSAQTEADEMISRVKKQNEAQRLAAQKADQAREREEADFLDLIREHEGMIAEKHNEAREVQSSIGEQQKLLAELEAERDAALRSEQEAHKIALEKRNNLKCDVNALENVELPRLKQQLVVAKSTSALSTSLMEQLRELQTDLAAERDSRAAQISEEIAHVSATTYEAMILRLTDEKMDVLSAIEREEATHAALKEAVQHLAGQAV